MKLFVSALFLATNAWAFNITVSKEIGTQRSVRVIHQDIKKDKKYFSRHKHGLLEISGVLFTKETVSKHVQVDF